MCLCLRAHVCTTVSKKNTASKMSLIQSGWCQQSHLLTMREPKYTHTYVHTVVRHINSITSRASDKLLIPRWLTFSVFEALPIKDFFTCRDLSLSLRVMKCPTLHLLLCKESLPQRPFMSITLFIVCRNNKYKICFAAYTPIHMYSSTL